MSNSYANILPYVILLCVCLDLVAYSALGNNSTLCNFEAFVASKGTFKVLNDSIPEKVKQEFTSFKNNLSTSGSSKIKYSKDVLLNIKASKPDSILKSFLFRSNLKDIINTKPFLKINGGVIVYNLNFRSNIDTPFAEKNILQHSIYGNLSLSLSGLPFKANYLVRRSNSMLFADINDIQLEFDAIRFGNDLRSSIRERLLTLSSGLKDSLLELNLSFNQQKLLKLDRELKNPFKSQKLIEYKEMLRIPGITHDSKLSDSLNKIRSVQLLREAKTFIDNYYTSKQQYEELKNKVDSLLMIRNKNLAKIQAFKSMIVEKISNAKSLSEVNKDLQAYGLSSGIIPKKYIWLFNLRKFSIGKTQVNHSELTSKNLRINGVNFEYNSWYYLGFTAGAVDYRFRDFVIKRNNRLPQFIYMGRVGIGRLENSHFFVTVYKGKKQLFAVTNSNSGSTTIDISGIAIEAKYRLFNNGYFLAEAAESLSPDFRKNPATIQKFDLKDKSNKAISAKFYYYLTKTRSKIEAMYKYTGGNFQSFSSFQTNAALEMWYVKADQHFLNRKLKVTAAIRKNEFSNPYVIQNYKSNTVFKSLQATYKAKKMPGVTIGYVPTSQITSIDSQLVENHFYSFNAAITHSYKLGNKKANSSLVYNRFYNNQSDTSFLYFNAINIFFNQSVYFSAYVMNISISHSSNRDFKLDVLDGNLQFLLKKYASVAIGLKVNSFNKQILATGGYVNLNLIMKKFGAISMTYDKGYIPASNHHFVQNEMMNLNFTRTF